jgi:hypothetical protein
VVARERVSDILLKYPKGLHVNELAKKISVEPKKLARIMRLLATRGCYNEGKKSFVAWLNFLSH